MNSRRATSYFVRHTDSGGWSNFYGPFRSIETARRFVKKVEPTLPEGHSVSYDVLESPANFSLQR